MTRRKRKVTHTEKRAIMKSGKPQLPAKEVNEMVSKARATQKGLNEPKLLLIRKETVQKHATISVGKINIPTKIPPSLLHEMVDERSGKMRRFKGTAEGTFVFGKLFLDVLRLPFRKDLLPQFRNLQIPAGTQILLISFQRIREGKKGNKTEIGSVESVFGLDGTLLAVVEKQPLV